MKSKSRLKRGFSIISIAGLTALGLVCLSEARLFAHSPKAAGALFAAPSGWTEAEKIGSVRSWEGEQDRKAFISVVEDASMKAEVPNPDDKKFLQVIEYASVIPNKFAGIQDWKVEKLERVKLADGHKVILTGTYVNAKGELIRFEEWKYFLKDGFGQINYSELAGPQARDRSQVAELLKRYHPFGT